MGYSIIASSCGLCCSKESLCEKCEIATLKANGLSTDLFMELRGLNQRSRSHGNGFEFSELYKKLRDLMEPGYQLWLKEQQLTTK